MGLWTRNWIRQWDHFLRSWTVFLLSLYVQISQVKACPDICRCDRTFVYCNERSLTSVPPGIPEGMKTLYLHNNQINNAGFPEELYNIESVETVFLYGNQLDEFPVNLPRNVRVLHLQENNIMTISRFALAQLQKLEELHLDDNSISTVGIEDGAFREAGSLKLLFLSKNHLSSVPVGLPLQLKELRVDENRIATISNMAFQNLTSLERLILDGNLLTNSGIEEGTFSYLSKLTEFSMVRNSLTDPPSDLPSTYLVKFNLQDNQITQIPVNTFEYFSELQILDISNNQLHALQQGVFDGLSNLKQLTVRNNPWHCNCSIGWITQWLKSLPSFINVRGFMCQTPEKVRGMAVRELNADLLACPIVFPSSPVTTQAFATLVPVTLGSSTSDTKTVTSDTSYTTHSITSLPSQDGNEDKGEGIGDSVYHDEETTHVSILFVNDTCIQISWTASFSVMSYKLTWVKMGHSLIGGIVKEKLISSQIRQTNLYDLEPKSTYRICLAPLDAFNNYKAGEETVCCEATTKASSFNSSDNKASSHEQITPHSPGSPFLLAGLIGGAVIVVLVVLLSIFCWHVHKKNRSSSNKWKYNRGRRKDDYCEAGTKMDNSILEMTETGFQIVSLNNEELLKGGDFRLQPIYAPNGGLGHVSNNIHYCSGTVKTWNVVIHDSALQCKLTKNFVKKLRLINCFSDIFCVFGKPVIYTVYYKMEFKKILSFLFLVNC
ncbi:leucine-rich repeat transmembrane protein FLRT2 [Protopterus annectens]|uniref:leucine-rich repeat transmembrane protein FLRT2 n=1 Tax=Protopterus annectens TaxID=7888 RepID=UPI001CF984E0|nr:leucine-rich repeat transmembrane protein FLRT2 [Protopterus annectens]